MLPLFAVTGVILIAVMLHGKSLIESSDRQWTEWGYVIVPLVMLVLLGRAIQFVHQSLLSPLIEIRQWLSRLIMGDMSARMPPLSPGEFNALADDLNTLTRWTEKLHGDLQSEVIAQTDKVAQKTQALELLYELVTSVNEAYEVNDLLSHFMCRLGDIYEAESGVMRVLEGAELRLVDSYGFGGPSSDYLVPRVPIGAIVQKDRFGRAMVDIRHEAINQESVVNRSGKGVEGYRQMISIPLQYRDSVLGCYQMFVHSERQLEEETTALLGSIGRHLGVAVEQSRLDQDASRLVMVEERARVANELHDSLAQTLASLRFQVRVLDETLHQGNEQVTWEELEKLEDQVEEANRELRLLIGRFRAPLQSRSVVISVEKIIRKFRQDTGTAVFFQNEWSDDNLPSVMRDQIVGIVQEALTNVKKHADAKTVRVLLRHHNGHYRIMIEDDGVGFDESLPERGQSGEHIGRQIMAERTESLGGTLRVDSEAGEGCSVSLEFDWTLGPESEASESLSGVPS